MTTTQPVRAVRRGDVVPVLFPDPDLRTGQDPTVYAAIGS
jgi:hypothetical protein